MKQLKIKPDYRAQGYRCWYIHQTEVKLWCRSPRTSKKTCWYVLFVGGNSSVDGSWHWHVTREQASILLQLVSLEREANSEGN